MTETSANTDGAFRRSAINRVASADELDHYIKVTNPSAWVVITAALLLIAGIIVWALVAIVPITVNTTGVTVNDYNLDKPMVVCWVNKSTAQKIQESGAKASIDGVKAKKVLLSQEPMSASEVARFLGSDFYIESIDLDDWNYLVTIEPGGDLPQPNFTVETQIGDAKLVPVSIVVAESRPINIVLGKE